VSEQSVGKLKMSGDIICNLTDLLQTPGWREEHSYCKWGFFDYGQFNDSVL